jgi:formylglycine-generating enzyme required for sulfatase activity/class 3 adenylate cyclase
VGSIDLRFQSNYNGKTRFRKVQGTFVSDDNDKRTRGQVYPFRPDRNGSGPPDELPRRLAAILAADIAGYSRLMGHDEEGTHARIRRQRRELIEPTIAEHHGRLVKYTGDGFLAMFDSPVEAVRCAIVIQQTMIGRNTSLPLEQRILYRIGVNLGDVIVDTDDIYGEGVNIAARLEGIARPGDLYISGGVYEQIKNKLVCGYQSLGDRQVKNITDPVTVYRVLPDPAALVAARRSNKFIGAIISVGLLILGGVGGYFFIVKYYAPQASPPLATAENAKAPEPAVTPSAPQLPSKPTEAPAQIEIPKVIPTPPTTTEKAKTPEPAVTPSAPQLPPKPTQQAPATVTPSAPLSKPTEAPASTETPKVSPAPPTPVPTLLTPEMIPIPGNSFSMGSSDDVSERPIHRVTIKPFAISKFPVTVREWSQCVAAKACSYVATGKDEAPVTNISWDDAQEFVRWLSQVSQKTFRLPSEAEWEYAARGGTQTKYWWGDQPQPDMANCKGCGGAYDPSQPLKVGSFKANPFGLYDMGGSVDQWVEDCWHKGYQGAPNEGSAWLDKTCASRVIRSGSWRNDQSYVRPASRQGYDAGVRYPTHGFRVAAPP